MPPPRTKPSIAFETQLTDFIDSINQLEPTERLKQLTVLRSMLGIMRGTRNLKLSGECLLIATGLHDSLMTETTKVTMSSIARKHGVSRAAVSKRVRKICRDWGLKPSLLMRPEKTVERCRRSRIKSHLSTISK